MNFSSISLKLPYVQNEHVSVEEERKCYYSTIKVCDGNWYLWLPCFSPFIAKDFTDQMKVEVAEIEEGSGRAAQPSSL